MDTTKFVVYTTNLMKEISGYQTFKLYLTELLGVSRDGFHVLLGFLVFLLVAGVFKLRLSSPKTLIAPLLFVVVLEVFDTRDALVYGFPVDILDSIHDMLIGMLLPVLTVLYARSAERRKSDNV